MAQPALVRGAGVVVFTVAAALLTSIGGLGIVASPVTLPLMYAVVAANPTRVFRVAGVVIGGLSALEGGWGLGFLMFGDDAPATVATMLVVALASLVAFASAGRRTVLSAA